MKSKLIKFFFYSIILVFSGCTNSTNYNVVPVYNKIESTVNIDTFQLTNATMKFSQNLTPKIKSSKFDGIYAGYYFTNNDKCERIIFKFLKSTDNKTCFPNDFETNLKLSYNQKVDAKCDIETFANLKFLQCSVAENSKGSLYYIVSSVRVHEYFFDKLVLLEVDKMCFNTIKTHFENKAVEGKVKIQNSVFISSAKPKTNQYNYTQMCNDYLENDPFSQNDMMILETYMEKELNAIDPLIIDAKERKVRLHKALTEKAKQLQEMTIYTEVNKYQNNPENILYRVNGEDIKEGRLYCILKNNKTITQSFDKMNQDVQNKILELLKTNIILTQYAKTSH